MTRLSLILWFLFGASTLTLTGILSMGQSESAQLQKGEVATRIDGANVTEKERAHSKLLSKYKTGRNLRELTSSEQTQNEIIVKKLTSPPSVPIERGCPKYPNPWYVGLTRAADVVVLGAIRNKVSSQLTDDAEFLFTEYEVTIDDVIKDNPNASLQGRSIINVVRPGGRAILNGKTVNAVLPSFEAFKDGEHYLFFLRYIEETGSYQAFSTGSFRIMNGIVTTFNNNRTQQNDQSLIAEVKAAMTASYCQKAALS